MLEIIAILLALILFAVLGVFLSVAAQARQIIVTAAKRAGAFIKSRRQGLCQVAALVTVVLIVGAVVVPAVMKKREEARRIQWYEDQLASQPSYQDRVKLCKDYDPDTRAGGSGIWSRTPDFFDLYCPAKPKLFTIPPKSIEIPRPVVCFSPWGC